MADVRALLKAKREEKRISHPFAAYSQAGQLRCTACSTIIKHASAWNGHLGSKSHRTHAARIKEEERLKKEAKEDERRLLGKRKVVDGNDDLPDEATKKPRLHNEDEQHQSTPLSNTSATDLPSDFFSDPSRAVVIGDSDSDDEEGDKDNPPPAITTPQSQAILDLEWVKFQKAVVNTSAEVDARETYERATVFAEAQLSTEIPEGFPSSVVRENDVEPPAETTPVLKDEGEERRRREEEEKELIMDRLLDEERAQEEADERVNALKARLDLLRQKRMAAKTTRTDH